MRLAPYREARRLHETELPLRYDGRTVPVGMRVGNFGRARWRYGPCGRGGQRSVVARAGDEAGVPDVARADWCATPIDRFILARLEADDMQPAPPLARERLIRRVYFDLWGLPPTPEEVRAFLADESPRRLRAAGRPAVGQSSFWRALGPLLARRGALCRDQRLRARRREAGRLALSRLGHPGHQRATCRTTASCSNNWPAMNCRMPATQHLAATGLLRVGTFDDEPNDPLVYKYEQLDDLIGATSTSFLALTREMRSLPRS